MVESARSKVGFSLGGGAGAKAKAKAKARALATGDDELNAGSSGVEKEFITTVANGEIEPADGARKKAEANEAKVIPCLADTWKGAAESTSSDGRKKYVPSAAAELKVSREG